MDHPRGYNLIAGRHHEGNSLHGIPPSRINADFYNMIGDELVELVEAAGLDPDYSKRTQVRDAVIELSGGLDVRAFGADPEAGPNTNTRAIQAALDSVSTGSGGTVRISGGTYRIHGLHIRGHRVHLAIEAGSTLDAVTPLARIVTVTGDDVIVTGPGEVRCPIAFDARNARNTIAVFWVESCTGFRAQDLTLNGIPRCGFQFENATAAALRGVRARGGYPSSLYDEKSTTGHFFVFYDPPANATHGGLSVIDCHVVDCVQGIAGGNYDGAAALTGIRVTGNTFVRCWDHAVYTRGDRGMVVAGNTMLDCRRPIAIEGEATTISGNTLHASDIVDTYHEQAISMRSARNCVVVANTLHGVGAGIDCSQLGAIPPQGNMILGNTLIQMAPSRYLIENIRMRATSAGSASNAIIGNRIITRSDNNVRGAIGLYAPAEIPMIDTVVRDNSLTIEGLMPAVFIRGQDGARIEKNTINFSSQSYRPTTLSCIYADDSLACSIQGNSITYRRGGQGVSVRGIQIDPKCASMTITDNSIRLEAPQNALPIIDRGTNTHLSGNRIGDAPLSADVTLSPGQTSVVVETPNVHEASVIHLMPMTPEAAMTPVFVTPSAGRFSVSMVQPETSGAEVARWRFRLL